MSTGSGRPETSTLDGGTADVKWAAPGPGTWERDKSHFEPTVSRIAVDVMEQAAPLGLQEGMALVGAPIETMDVRFVNGQMYRRLVPIIGGASSRRPPPAWLIRAVFALHPRLRPRAKVADKAMESKVWRSEADRWQSEWKPRLLETNSRLGRVALGRLDNQELSDHVDECVEHLLWSTNLHFRLHVSDLGPIGILLDETSEWGLDVVEVMAALAGASPSTSAPSDALRELAAELAAAGVEPHTLDDVRGAGERAKSLLDAYLAEFGNRHTTGYDLTDLTLAEMPDVILSSLRDAGTGDDVSAADAATQRGAAAMAALHARVPASEHARLNGLVDDARRLYGLRDENGPLTIEWPGGVLRMAMLEAGARLHAVDRIMSPEHVFDLSHAELVGSLRGEVGPHSQAVATRHARRMAQAVAESPAHLGPAPTEPDLAGLPEGMQMLMRLTLKVVGLLEAAPPSKDATDDCFRGTGIGTASYRGVARVVADADEAMQRAAPGDVIVTRFTAPTFNSVLAMAGAVVTEQGGPLCHTAVIARELGIPAVVGAHGVLALTDGSEVLVDPIAGRVTVLSD